MTRTILLTLMRACIGFIVAIFVWVVVTVLFWAYYPYETSQVAEPIEVLNENHIVEPNGLLDLKVLIEKTGNYSPQVFISIICDNGGVYEALREDSLITIPVGEFERVRSFRISKDVPVGSECVFQFRNEYDVNAIRTIVRIWQSEKFLVLENTDGTSK